MDPDLRERLRRLGVHKGAAGLKTLKPSAEAELAAARAQPRERAAAAGRDAPLEPIRTALGYAYARREVYALDHRHGDRPLAWGLQHPPELVARLLTRGGDMPIDLRDALFLDTETTGLAGGAGTLAFLVGLGYVDGDRFVVEQFFLRDPAEEAAMLCEIDRLVNRHSGLVTFNGQSFDVPLLESRFILARIAPAFAAKMHLDLLMPARRAWRGSLESCSLGSLEYHLLGVERAQRDVPGSVIPFLYREYLSSGGGDLNDDMQRVMYHNLHDILSMVTLASRLVETLTQPRDAGEHFTAARYFERAGDYAAAERGYRAAASHAEAQRRLARLLKKQGKPGDAFVLWEGLAEGDDVEALIEVAKHCEWRAADLQRALLCTQRALARCEDRAVRIALAHRMQRLERKASRE
jgi:hypothetical protein